MPKLQLGFHTTFALKKEDVRKVLNAASSEVGLKDSPDNLLVRTGLGNRKIGPVQSWAARAGLIANKRLSPEGEIVLRHDPYLDSLITDWLMHFYLSFGSNSLAQPPDDPADWGGWTWFVYDFAPRHTDFTADQLTQASSDIFDDSPKLLAKNFKYLLRAYTEPQALKGCQYLTFSGNSYSTQNPSLPNPYLIGYFLAKLWQRDYPGQTCQLTETILNQPYGIAPILSLWPEQIQPHLNDLETRGPIAQLSRDSPSQIVPRWSDPLELLDQAYQA
ncbi:MAG: DUF4007 family protein [Spirulinaceae cyanobacterium SM2_1_0]|nr:DUF4007 family protein [Spirulinaceae cyanobacterium SM2_1_0]